jgi:hypothetical protein
VDIREYPDMRVAEASTSGIATGAVFIFAELTPESLQVLNLGQMDAILSEYHSRGNRITLPAFKPESTLLCLDIIPVLAKEANKMATKKTPAKKATAKKTPAAKKAPAKRRAGLEGKKLFKTGEREKGKGHKDSRRARSYALIKKGMKYEAAIAAGAHKDDIARMLYDNQLEAK